MARSKRRDEARRSDAGARGAKAAEAAPRGGAARRRGYQRRSRWQPIGLRAALAAGVLIAVALIVNEAGIFAPSAGFEVPDQGQGHVPSGTNVSYNSIPPASGPHYATEAAPWGSFDSRWPDPLVVHSLEHGGIAIAYNGLDEAEVERLESFLRTFRPSQYGGRVKLVIHPDERLNEGEIVLTAWRRMDRMNEIDEERIRSFYEIYLDRCCEEVP